MIMFLCYLSLVLFTEALIVPGPSLCSNPEPPGLPPHETYHPKRVPVCLYVSGLDMSLYVSVPVCVCLLWIFLSVRS